MLMTFFFVSWILVQFMFSVQLVNVQWIDKYNIEKTLCGFKTELLLLVVGWEIRTYQSSPQQNI